MKTVYVVVNKDRHIDLSLTVFSSGLDAISYAEGLWHEYLDDYGYGENDFDSEKMDQQSLERNGWIYYRVYSHEGDCIWIERCEVYGLK